MKLHTLIHVENNKKISKMARNENKILIMGGTGYIGSYMVKASIKLGHPTYVYSRPNSSKTELLNEFESMGAVIVKVGNF